MSGTDLKKLQPSIDALNAEIARLTSARDTLTALGGTTKAIQNASSVKLRKGQNEYAKH